ncbi:hypothetical protein L1987_01524 [Smallanthus sonchifolius]|uniref:Uncharacterized protein n=1 Tax=Smallanthus sonchifolius TaxID=185202 RepID=A0ACB9K5G7_9ASTR|nr:hypothetical protein L1987_01524 [Smallanthus sonchifolius]
MSFQSIVDGLPTEDDMGNSEVGHKDLGAGRIYKEVEKLESNDENDQPDAKDLRTRILESMLGMRYNLQLCILMITLKQMLKVENHKYLSFVLQYEYKSLHLEVESEVQMRS